MTPSKHRRAMLAKETDPEWKIIANAETDAAFEPEADAIIKQRAAEIRRKHLAMRQPVCDKPAGSLGRLEARAVPDRVFDELDWDEE